MTPEYHLSSFEWEPKTNTLWSKVNIGKNCKKLRVIGGNETKTFLYKITLFDDRAASDYRIFISECGKFILKVL